MAFLKARKTKVAALAICSSFIAHKPMAADLPPYVTGPISGFIYDCRQAGQKPPDPRAYVSTGDLDGDGKPDHLVDSAKGCDANRQLYCNAEGCVIDIYLSSTGDSRGSFRAKSFRIVKRGTKPTLSIVKGGDQCGATGCTVTLSFDGQAFVESP